MCTFGDELDHIARSNYINAASIRGVEPSSDIDAILKLKSKDEILAALQESFAAVKKAVSTLTPANANEPVDDPGIGPHTTRETEAVWVAVHGSDHYGQLVEYLRMNGIAPPERVAPTAQ